MKMKKFSFIFTGLITGLFLLILQGCTEVLDLKPNNDISDASFWKTPDQFKLAANEFYTYLYSWGGPRSDFHADLVTTEYRNTVSNGTYIISQTDANGTSWNTGYSKIRNINYLLEKAKEYSNPEEINKYVAEARFFRAFIYFDLLQQFGGVVIVDHLLTPGSPELYSPQNSRDDVINFILDDLNAAIPELPYESNIETSDKGRISRGAADAFLSRVTLYEGTWQKFRGNVTRANILLDSCINASNRVITRGEYELFKPAELGDSALKYLFILEDEKSNPAGITKSSNKEFIINNRYSYDLRQARRGITHTYGHYLYWPLKKFVDMYLCQDGLPIEKSSLFLGYTTQKSEYLNRDNRMRYTLMIDGEYYWDNDRARITWSGDPIDIANSLGLFNGRQAAGYQNQKFASERKFLDMEEGYDYGVLRYAEVLLIYAEAVFERNGYISDIDLNKSINLVRNRVNLAMPRLSNNFVASNGLDMRTEIRRERTVELFLEGFRWDDLKRWKTAEIEMVQPLLGIKWKGTSWETYWTNPGWPIDNATGCILVEAANARTFDPGKHYFYPIPTNEITQSKNNLVQNPGW
jgi:starch-binding outer membrane protein, SusD/RagB family